MRRERKLPALDYQIREIERLDEFEAEAAAWDGLLARSSCDTMFLTSAWLGAWWRAHDGRCRPRVICALEGGRLAAAAPLCARRSRYYRVPITELCFLGDLTSDRQDFLARPGEAGALEAIWRRLRDQPRGCAIVRLEEMPAQSAAVAAGRRVWRGFESETSSNLPYLPIRSDWAAFEATLSRKFCSEMRTRPKLFAGWGAWRYDVTEGTGILEQLDEAIAVEAASHKARQGRAFYADPANREFMRRLLAAPGAIRPLLFTLRVQQRLVSYILGFVYGGVYHAYNGAFLPGYAKGSVGKWLFHQTVRHAFENGLRGFDFLRGASYLKTRWRPEDRPQVRAVAFQPGLAAELLRLAVFRVRPWMKRRLPARRAAASPVG